MSAPSSPIRVRTYMRTGSGERLVDDRILRPLTKDERRQGVRDAYREYIAEFGVPGAKRRKSRSRRRVRDEGCGQDTELNMMFDSEGVPSKEDQETMYEMMKHHLKRVACDLAATGVIRQDDIPDAESEFFIVCRDSLKNWDPSRAGLKTFLYERVASAKIDYVRYVKREKRAFNYTHLHIAARPSDCDEDQSNPASFSTMIDPDVLSDRHALEKMLFAWSLADLIEFLDADERLALDYLLQDYTQEETAKWMSCTLMQFRRHVLQSLQMKAVNCGFEPCNGAMVCRG